MFDDWLDALFDAASDTLFDQLVEVFDSWMDAQLVSPLMRSFHALLDVLSDPLCKQRTHLCYAVCDVTIIYRCLDDILMIFESVNSKRSKNKST